MDIKIVCNIVSSILSTMLEKKVLFNVVDNLIEVYINGIGGCKLEITKDKNIKVHEFDISEKLVELIKQSIMSYLK